MNLQSMETSVQRLSKEPVSAFLSPIPPRIPHLRGRALPALKWSTQLWKAMAGGLVVSWIPSVTTGRLVDRSDAGVADY